MKSTLLMFLPALAIGAIALAAPETPVEGTTPSCCKKACPSASTECTECKDCPPACKAGKALDAALTKLAAVAEKDAALEAEARAELAAKRVAGIDRVGLRKDALRAAADLIETAARAELTAEKPNARRAQLLLKIAAGHDRLVSYFEASAAPAMREAKPFAGKEDAGAAVSAMLMAYDSGCGDPSACCDGAEACCESKTVAKHEPAAEVVGAVRAMMGAMKVLSADGDPCVAKAVELTKAATAGCCADWAECCETPASAACAEKAAG